MEAVDVLIVGAGLSGIGAAWHLQDRCPGKSFAILEARDAIGGTWDLFRYPGIRSDSDMHTLGYRFKPWVKAKAIADGPSIREYVTETAHEAGIDQHIRFGHKVVSASWSSAEARWTIIAERKDGTRAEFTARFLMMCSGYYDYAQGHRPEFPNEKAYKGTFIHPQHWPEDLDYAGKRIVVIGSGATAVTLVPSLAEKAAHVTMLQRSPTYYFDRPGEDAFANGLRARIGPRAAYAATRVKNVGLQQFFYRMARKHPDRAKERLIGMVREALGPDYDVDTHFTPAYNPWDQRICLVPDSDMFVAIREGRADVVTDEIASFTATGIKLKSGRTIDADIVVTATGLKLNLLGDVSFTIDGQAANLSDRLIYKGMMLNDVPNMMFVFGYTNASWTLKADLTSEYFCRLINYMDANSLVVAQPHAKAGAVEREPFVDFSSGYIQRALDLLPKQGTKRPWKLYQNYALDLVTLRFGGIADGTLQFTSMIEHNRAA